MWPHETSSCKLRFGSWTSHGDQIELELFRNQTKVSFTMCLLKKQQFKEEQERYKGELST